MAGEVVDSVGGVLGLAGIDGLTVISGLKDALFPDPPAIQYNNFQVRVGLIDSSDDESRSLGGHAPALATWDGIGRFLNAFVPEGGKIKEDTSKDYSILGPGEADYLSVVQTGNDGICISQISGKTNGGLEFMWTGDIGRVCGAPWYPQSNAIGQLANTTDYAPACVWIDGNADDDHVWRGFNFHLSSFPGTQGDATAVARARNLAEAWNGNLDLLCKSEPRFSMYEDIKIGNSIRYFIDNPSGPSDDPDVVERVLGADNWAWGEKVPSDKLQNIPGSRPPAFVSPCDTDDPPECPPIGPSFNRDLPRLPNVLITPDKNDKRSFEARQAATRAYVKKRQPIHGGRLIVTALSYHSAIELCDSPYSLGPDMVSTLENMYCDMSEKRLWPVCADASASYCFDMTSQTVRGSDTSNLDSPTWSNTSFTASGAVSLVAGNSANSDPSVPVKSYTTVDSWGN